MFKITVAVTQTPHFKSHCRPPYCLASRLYQIIDLGNKPENSLCAREQSLAADFCPGLHRGTIYTCCSLFWYPDVGPEYISKWLKYAPETTGDDYPIQIEPHCQIVPAADLSVRVFFFLYSK